MIVLALETSCDETAASVVRATPLGPLVLSSVVASQHDLHAEYAGVVPEIASRAHVEAVLPVIREALEHAGLGLGLIDAIAVGNRPGLIGSLLVGVAAAKSLAWSLAKPVIGVDHVLAHLYSGLLLDPSDPQPAPASPAPHDPLFPALGLVVSGGHTAMYEVGFEASSNPWAAVRRIGSTIDDAMGEAYDKVATLLGLPHPGGPNLDTLASSPNANDRALDLPISRLSPTSLDFSFSGLKTAMLYSVKGVPVEGVYPHDKPPLTPQDNANLAASFQRAACNAILLKLDRALRATTTRPRSLLAGGGVLANSRLRRELIAFAQAQGLALRLPAMRYCMDNAAMIAGLGSQLLQAGQRSDMSLQAIPTAAN